MIIVEGVDASGKSTLVQFLADNLRYPVQRSEGPPKHEGEMTERLERYAADLPDNIIFDRHPIISQPIYGAMRNTSPGFDTELWLPWLYNLKKPFIIYCEPGERGLNGHKRNTVDTDEHIAQIEANYETLRLHYRNWALQHANYIYRIGDDMNRVLHAVRPPHTDLYEDIRLFHEKYMLDYDSPPRDLPEDMSQFRIKFMFEELCEYCGFDAATEVYLRTQFMSCVQNNVIERPLEQQLDALVDLVYVAIGTAYLQGFDFNEAWRRVQSANMKKERVESSFDSKRGSRYDVIKPQGWTPPDLSDLV